MSSKLKIDEITTVAETGNVKTIGNIMIDMSSCNTGISLPKGTTAQRPSSPVEGTIRYNTEEEVVEFWDGTEWLYLQ